MVPIHWSAADLVQFTNHIPKFKCKIGENRGAFCSTVPTLLVKVLATTTKTYGDEWTACDKRLNGEEAKNYRLFAVGQKCNGEDLIYWL